MMASKRATEAKPGQLQRPLGHRLGPPLVARRAVEPIDSVARRRQAIQDCEGDGFGRCTPWIPLTRVGRLKARVIS